MYVQSTRGRISRCYNWLQTYLNGPCQGTRSNHLDSTQEPHRTEGIHQLPELLSSVHQRILQTHVTTTWLNKKGVLWQWTEKEQHAFDTLKAKVAEEPVLLFPQMTKPFELEVDASAITIGAVLNQKGDDNKLHPVAYYSESFTATKHNYDVYDWELLAIVKALWQWRMYLLGSPHPILIHMDHSNLQYWKEPRKINRRVAREFQELLEYNFILKHIPGSTNTQADTLSRQANGTYVKDNNNDVIVLPSNVFIHAMSISLNNIDTACQQAQNIHKDMILSWVDHHNLQQHDQVVG